jgi:hypothetical protein
MNQCMIHVLITDGFLYSLNSYFNVFDGFDIKNLLIALI